MKSNHVHTTMIGLVTIALVAMGTLAFGGQGMRNQNDGRGCRGNANCQWERDCAGGQRGANLTDEQREQLNTERQAFFETTKDARQEVHAKQLALRAEMAKSQPELQVASGLQKEISDLRADLAQKRLNHIMAMRKINPDAGRGYFSENRGRHGKRSCKGYRQANCSQGTSD